MNLTFLRSTLCSFGLVSLFVLVPCARAQFTPPTPEELQMTSQPQVPGAPAVYLYREEVTDDNLHAWSKYVRLKVLNEKGKDYANVELTQFSGEDSWGERSGMDVTGIQGRTIHPDGTVIPFTGKPYEKVIEKSKTLKVTAKVFTLPDVEVGSIIEYRYTLRWDDNRYFEPRWLIQSDLFTRNAHYLWKPTDKELMARDEKGEQLTSRILWAQILPPGSDLKDTRTPGSGFNAGQEMIDLKVHDVPPVPKEEFMPPLRSFSYRVLFYYSPYKNGDEYWKNTGKGWSKNADKFIGPGPAVGSAVETIIAGANTQDDKLHKIYEAVMQLENTTLSGSHSGQDENGKSLQPPKNTDEVWERKRGSEDQIAELFVAMARAAGMKAYLMAVPNRDRTLFTPVYLSFSQFDGYIAIVNVDGKERFFDPGQRYCPYGHLSWRHSSNQGLRQTDNGTAVADTSQESYKDSRIDRIADLKVDEHGEASGTVRLTWTGAPALRWRQESLRGDVTGLNHDLEKEAESMLPASMEIKLLTVGKLQDYEQPFSVTFTVKGGIGTATGKRLILPSDVFEVNSKPAFPNEKRDMAVCFDYPVANYDAMRITFPPTLAIESQPPAIKLPLLHSAAYTMDSKVAPNSITFYRNLISGQSVYMPNEYQDLRTFYNKLETADQQPLILKAAAATTTQAGGN